MCSQVEREPYVNFVPAVVGIVPYVLVLLSASVFQEVVRYGGLSKHRR